MAGDETGTFSMYFLAHRTPVLKIGDAVENEDDDESG
jgi:hypothetical protein